MKDIGVNKKIVWHGQLPLNKIVHNLFFRKYNSKILKIYKKDYPENDIFLIAKLNLYSPQHQHLINFLKSTNYYNIVEDIKETEHVIDNFNGVDIKIKQQGKIIDISFAGNDLNDMYNKCLLITDKLREFSCKLILTDEKEIRDKCEDVL